ncbi:hypothetical protein GIB67_011635 [Kingdonia uniflora]|uniref:DNA repair protein RAD16 n=1 Tax=Kingdonia uniflora TaxID=39325 RepID=A0A7J7NMJ8_9MAGN|nr:hypothetical protein GIB67_011635 [Kingdonia uniflora]
MKRRGGRRAVKPRNTNNAKRAKTRNVSDGDEDFAPPSDFDDDIEINAGGAPLPISDEPIEIKKRRISNEGKGKAVIEVNDLSSDELKSDSGSDCSASEYYNKGFDELNDDTSDSDYDGQGKNKKAFSNKWSNRATSKAQVELGPEEVLVDYFEEPEVVPVVKKLPKRRGRKKANRPPLLWEVWEDEHSKWIDEWVATNGREDNLDFECQDGGMLVETAEASQDLLMPLLRYQKEWLAWALKQEDSSNRGGILADEMGMGKTIQAIALVLAKRAIRQGGCQTYEDTPSTSSSLALPEAKCTLVICPVVAVLQWVNEIAKFTQEGSTRVLVYHGTSRTKDQARFFDYDFVITTYSIVESEYRTYEMPPKDKCLWCGKRFLSKRLKVHLQRYCGPDAVKTAKQSKQMKKDKVGYESKEVNADEFEGSKGKESNKKGKKKVKPSGKDKELGVDSSKEIPASGKSILHSVKWERIILDEAHFIKDRTSSTAKAIFTLESSYKWALSGTPLQNRVGELYSLVRFLRVNPYSYYFCKDCDCRTLDYSATPQCPACPHKATRHLCWWNRNVAIPIQNSGNVDEGGRAMILLKHKLLKSIVLRRTKKGRAADLALPPRIVTLRRDTLDIKEADYYQSLYNESQIQFNTYVEAGTLTNNYAHIFDLLTRLRQAVDHPYLVIYSKTALMKNENSDNANNGRACDLCQDPVEDPVVTSCLHVFCRTCLIDYSAALGQVSCPSCAKPLTADFTTKMDTGDQSSKKTVRGFRCSSILNKIFLEDFQTSTKIDALREEIRFMIERDGSAKGIVFSQFTSFLDLIHYSLQKSGIQCVQLVGSMTMAARDAAITKFTNDPDCKIFLMSLKAGGVALNLTVASHVFLMDPWWNPAVERQAQDRIHRIGQYKPIRIVRFVIENTVEDRILKLQEKKELVFEGLPAEKFPVQTMQTQSILNGKKQLPGLEQ